MRECAVLTAACVMKTSDRRTQRNMTELPEGRWTNKAVQYEEGWKKMCEDRMRQIPIHQRILLENGKNFSTALRKIPIRHMSIFPLLNIRHMCFFLLRKLYKLFKNGVFPAEGKKVMLQCNWHILLVKFFFFTRVEVLCQLNRKALHSVTSTNCVLFQMLKFQWLKCL